MSAPDYAAVLTAIRPDSLWGMTDNDYSTLTWHSDDPKPTKKTLDDAWPRVEYERQLAAVKAEREARYRHETDPMFMKVQRGEDGVTLDDWKAAVNQIRADLPYPEEP
ncbi:MAG TPA: hypothetical protein VIG24_18440 [Acidimicrobiia bacterium]